MELEIRELVVAPIEPSPRSLYLNASLAMYNLLVQYKRRKAQLLRLRLLHSWADKARLRPLKERLHKQVEFQDTQLQNNIVLIRHVYQSSQSSRLLDQLLNSRNLPLDQQLPRARLRPFELVLYQHLAQQHLSSSTTTLTNTDPHLGLLHRTYLLHLVDGGLRLRGRPSTQLNLTKRL